MEKIKNLFYVFFKDKGKPFTILDYQVQIAEAILYSKENRVIITATTRAGKSLIIALSTILYVIRNSDSKVLLIAPTYEQTKIIMNYIAEHIIDTKFVSNEVDLDRTMTVERLKKEVSKSKITFKNGSQISILSAEGEAQRLVGHGAGALVIVDESALIEDEVFRTKIMRMMGDNPNSKLIQIGNAIKLNHFYDSWQTPNYKKIHINWENCVEEGRLTKEYIEEQKSILTLDEFIMWYESEFVENPEDTLIKYQWIQNAINKEFKEKIIETVLGCDIASGGNDYTVLTQTGKTKKGNYIAGKITKKDEADTMITSGYITDQLKENKMKLANIDEAGIGKGVCDRVKEKGYKVNAIQGGESPTIEKNRFLNLKAQNYFFLRSLFEEGKISIPNEPQLIKELRKMRYEKTSAEKIKIIKPDDKSPDFADSLCYSVVEPHQRIAFGFV